LYQASPANSAAAVWAPVGSPAGIAQVAEAQPSDPTAPVPTSEPFTLKAMAFPGFPGEKFETALLLLGIPTKDKTGADVEKAIDAEIDKVVADGITAAELEAVKQRARASFIRDLRGNGGMAEQLAYYQTYMGDWRKLFAEVARIEAVTLEDVKRVAAEIFVPTNRTVAIIETEKDS
jgi:predicted Zn-dependent peptidase